MNSHLSKIVSTKACDLHSVDELNALLRDMLTLGSPELDAVYVQNTDDRAKRFSTLAEYEAAWAVEAGVDLETLRHAKCAEIVMMFAHHLSESSKKSFAKTLPTVPVYDEAKASHKTYAEALTCQSGHAMKKGGDGSSTHQWPDWPEELHYKAMGHGAYPFWWITSQSHEQDSAPMEVWWSEKQGAEKFYHSSCAGAYDWLQAPCYHMMYAPDSSGEYAAYLYNEEAEQDRWKTLPGHRGAHSPELDGRRNERVWCF